ncbi:hypothetical protein ACFPRA_19505 [Sporosarcina soli]|uniref:Uncharacterized protein n=1 Tax=Sporosarcina soli TaxID=334736 RepID=A0ABW0TNP4_9BACL
MLDTTKTAASERNIQLGQTIISILKKHRVWIKKNKLKYGAHYTDSDRVCVKENGNILTPSLIK